MIQKHKIRTDIGKDKLITVDIQQKFDILEILSLKFTQQDVYTSLCADYGVVCGRISVNNGYGIPNARVSIFVPLSENDSNDPVISTLYPYKTISDKDENQYRYNLLPSRKQHGGHAPTGTFPDQSDILTREEVLEVYEKYYKYTVKTNNSGDFMIWGVPLGQQTIHIDVDLSDIGCFSLRPDDFIRNGFGLDKFKTTYQFKPSVDLDSLPQIVSYNQTIEVFPFWGNPDLCSLGITRTDFDLSNHGVRIQPKAYVIGGFFSDTGHRSVNKNCQLKPKMGRKCDLTSPKAVIESIRFTTQRDSNQRPVLEILDTHEDVDESGAFSMTIDMNMDYVYTDEFGDTQFTNDSNKGIPTSAVYRFRASVKNETLSRTRTTASFMFPNIKEYTNDVLKSYAWSANYNDYPAAALSDITHNENGFYIPRDYFFRLNYNKVYTISQFQSAYFQSDIISSITNQKPILSIKEIVPAEEEDCTGSANTFPVNYATKNYTFTLLIADIILFIEHLLNLVSLTFYTTLVNVFQGLADATNFRPIRFVSRAFRKFAYTLQESTQRHMYLISYPECEECTGGNSYGIQSGGSAQIDYCSVGVVTIEGGSDLQNRSLVVTAGTFSVSQDGNCPSTANPITDLDDLINTQTNYILSYNSFTIDLTDTPFSKVPTYDTNGNITGYTYKFQDTNDYFSDYTSYIVLVLDKNATASNLPITLPLESGCDLYDTPYDESIIKYYYTGSTFQPVTTFTPGMDVTGTLLSDRTYYRLVTSFDGQSYTPISPSGSGFTEFSNGVFYIIPGTTSLTRLYAILKEYRRRKRVAKMFCGGVANYSFIDNWLSGSMYFFAFKAKNSKFCSNLVRWVPNHQKYYYRSCEYNSSTSSWGSSYYNGTKRINFPTTMVDLGPRDEFIKEICVDPALDPNCSIVRNIGPTSYKNFGELMGLAINYRMDVSNNDTDINTFFANTGFYAAGLPTSMDGDILQLVSINNEVGIEQFDLQNPLYLGYSYQVLDPEVFPDVFKVGGDWGPLPVTMHLSPDGQRERACINEPTYIDYYGNYVEGRLTESSQPVPFYLWDKKGSGFGTGGTNRNNQSFDYSHIEVQPLQGMSYGYNITGVPNDAGDKYLLLPMTNTFNGLIITGATGNATNEVPYEIVSLTDGHADFNSQYPGFQYLYVTSGTTTSPITGKLYTRYGAAGTDGIVGWDKIDWDYTHDFVLKRTQDYYSGNKQILSTPFMFYFGLRPGNTGLDKFIERFGPLGAFPSAE